MDPQSGIRPALDHCRPAHCLAPSSRPFGLANTLVETATLQRGHANDDGDDESSLWPETRQSQRVPAAARLRRMYKLKSQAAPIRDSK